MLRLSSDRLTMAIAAIVLLVTPCPAAGQTTEARGLTSELQAELPEYAASDSVGLRFTLTNTSGDTLSLLEWHTPLEGFNSDMFRVERDGEPILYVGRTVKRGAPEAGDYLTLAPGESVSEVVDLAQAYALYEQGDYSVAFVSRVYDVGTGEPSAMAATLLAKRDFQPKAVRSNAVTLKLTEERQRPPEPEAAPAAAGESAANAPPAFVACSASQQTVLDQALGKAEEMAVGAGLCLAVKESKRPSSDRYKTWFGAYDASRWNTVSGNFDKILDALSNQQMTFHCDCDDPYFAYVHPNNPYHVWLCNAFWSAPMTGTDSQAGTLIHEVSHFYAVASTRDDAYGHWNCQNQARTDPSKAIANADSHEYFAENTPELSCGLEHLAASIAVILLLAARDRVRYRRCRW